MTTFAGKGSCSLQQSWLRDLAPAGAMEKAAFVDHYAPETAIAFMVFKLSLRIKEGQTSKPYQM